MKKFLVLCISLIVVVSFGFMTVYFLSSQETIKVQDSSWANKNVVVNSEHTINFVIDDYDSTTNEESFSVRNTNDQVVQIVNASKPVSINTGNKKNQKIASFKFKAIAGGESTIKVAFDSATEEVFAFDFIINVADGSVDHPFKINSLDDLKQIGRSGGAFAPDKNYALTQDIVCEGEWDPIPEFSGKFYSDGPAKTISCLNFGNATGNVGLFSSITSTGAVYNVNLSGITANGNYSAFGCVAGVNNGSIYNVSVTNANITNSNATNSVTGGIVGINQLANGSKAKVTQSYFDGKITADANAIAGGIVGKNIDSIVGYTYTTANTTIDVKTNSSIGGIVGSNEYNGIANPNVLDSYSLAKTESATLANVKAGGIVGNQVQQEENYVYGCYYLTNNGFSAGVYGIADINANEDRTINHKNAGVICVASKEMSDLTKQNTFISYKNYKENLVNWNFNSIWTFASDASTPSLQISNVQANITAPTLQALPFIDNIDSFYNGDLNTFDQFAITSDINANGIVIADKVYASDGTTIISNNLINLTNKTITGTKDDNSPVVISNFTLKICEENASGFFKYIENSTLENIIFKPSRIEYVANSNRNDLYFGTVAYNISNSTLNNICIDLRALSSFELETIETNVCVGILSYRTDWSVLNNCNVYGANKALTINSKVKDKYTRLGGLIGLADHSVINNSSVNNLTISDVESYSGAIGGIAGIVGFSSGKATLNNCSCNNVTLSTENKKANRNDYHAIGGLVGFVNNDPSDDSPVINGGLVYNCTLKGLIVGGAVGYTHEGVTRVTINVTASGWKVGGVAGFQFHNSEISNCYITGSLKAVGDSFDFFSESQISNRAQVAGVSAVTKAASKEDCPNITKCLIACSFEGDAYKDSACLKHLTGSKAVGFIDSSSYENYTLTATISDTIINTSIASNAKNRYEISASNFGETVGSWFLSFQYDYSIIDWNGNDWNTLDVLGDAWNIDKNNKTISLK